MLGYTNLPEGMDVSVELSDENYNFSTSEWVVIKVLKLISCQIMAKN